MSQPISRVPIIRLWNLLLVPVQGDLGDSQVEQLKQEVLSAIHATSIEGLVLDVTGLWLMDSHLCAVLTRLAQAASLMGTRTVLCGMSAEIALTIQMMGLELNGVATALSLEQALEHFGVRGGGAEAEELDELTWNDAADDAVG
jgi:rsbT antagonist protein RsbS